MGSVRPLTYPAPRPGHPLADASSPKLAAVIILVIVLAAMGWSEEQILALLAVMAPLAITAAGEGQA